jgi:rod shape-determining protein MreC
VSNKFNVEFYSDFSQLKYVFAEVISKNEVKDANIDLSQNENVSQNSFDVKLKILEDEIKIIEDINLKFKEENETLKTDNNYLNILVSDLKNKVFSQKKEIEQFNLDTEEIEFLKMNLNYGHKCRKSFINPKGFLTGSPEYKKCVMNKGRKS